MIWQYYVYALVSRGAKLFQFSGTMYWKRSAGHICIHVICSCSKLFISLEFTFIKK